MIQMEMRRLLLEQYKMGIRNWDEERGDKQARNDVADVRLWLCGD